MNPALRLVRLLLEVTRAGRMRWTRNTRIPDLYEGQLGPETCTIRFVRFQRADKAHPDRHLAEITCFGVTTDHAVGTEGMDLAQQIISIGDPQLRAVRGAIRERVAEAEELLQAVLEAELTPTPATRTRSVKITPPARRVRVSR